MGRLGHLLLLAALPAAFGCSPAPLQEKDAELEELQRQLDALESIEGPLCPGGACPIDDPYFGEPRGADLPIEMRHTNYGGGSCYYASTCSALENLDAAELAAWIRQHHGGGASIGDIRRTLDRYNVDYVYTADGDFGVLEYAAANNLVAAIEFKSNHACSMVAMDPPYVWSGLGWSPNPARQVWILDNNHVGELEPWSLEKFQGEWYRQGGRAIVPLGLPLPPNFL